MHALARCVVAKLDDDVTLIHEKAYTQGRSRDQVRQQGQVEIADSKQTAEIVAFEHLGLDPQEHGTGAVVQRVSDTLPVKDHLQPGDVIESVLTDASWLAKPQSKSVVRALVRQILRQRTERDLEILARVVSAIDFESSIDNHSTIVLELAKLPREASAVDAPWIAKLRESHRQAAAMIARITPRKALPSEVVAQIVAKTDGVPLFVEELTKMVLESGLLQEREAHYELPGPLPPLAIPATLHDALKRVGV